MRHSHLTRDVVLYFLIGSIPVLIAASDPVGWRSVLASVLAGLTTVKGKLSKNPEPNPPPDDVK